MSEETRGEHRCQYLLVPGPHWGKTRACKQSARWVVSYLTPDDGLNLRVRKRELRCLTHTDSRFFPKGATGITTESVESALPPAVAHREGDHAD